MCFRPVFTTDRNSMKYLFREPEFVNEVDCWNPRGRKSPRLNLNSWCWLPEHQAEFDVEVLGRGRVRLR